MSKRTTLSLIFLFCGGTILAQFNLFGKLNEQPRVLLGVQKPRAGKVIEVKTRSRTYPFDLIGKVKKYVHNAAIYECTFLNDTVVSCTEKDADKHVLGIPAYSIVSDDPVYDHFILRNNSIITSNETYTERHKWKFINKDSAGFKVLYKWSYSAKTDSTKADSIFGEHLMTRTDDKRRLTYYYLHEPGEGNIRIKREIEYVGDTLQITKETEWYENDAPQTQIMKELIRWNKDSTEERERFITIRLNNDTLYGRNIDTSYFKVNYSYDADRRIVYEREITSYASNPAWVDRIEMWVKYKKE